MVDDGRHIIEHRQYGRRSGYRDSDAEADERELAD
jgi:hypothetical protein